MWTEAVQEEPGHLLIPKVSPEDAGKYALLATNPAGEAVHHFKVDVVCKGAETADMSDLFCYGINLSQSAWFVVLFRVL